MQLLFLHQLNNVYFAEETSSSGKAEDQNALDSTSKLDSQPAQECTGPKEPFDHQ